MSSFIGVLGLVVILGIAFAFSTDRNKVNARLIIWGLILQFAFALLVMKWSWGQLVFEWLSDIVRLGLEKADAGGEFVFGPLAKTETLGFIFAFRALPTIIYISSFFSVLYYLGILQKLVMFMAKIMVRTMGTSGAESLSTAANVFMGQTEAPLVVMPYIASMTYSELCTLMVGGMATISGGMMAAYISMGIEAKFLLAASVMNAPAAIVMAKILVPETGTPLMLPRAVPERDSILP
jgi:CNT family concentrative nucleoside transporter